MAENSNLNQFITKEMLLTLTGCIAIVCGLTQIFKGFCDFNPLWINLTASLFVAAIRTAFIGDFSFQGIVLGIMNFIPIMLGSSGFYEILKHSM